MSVQKQFRCLGSGIFHTHRYGGDVTQNPKYCGQCSEKIFWNRKKRSFYSLRFIIREWEFD